MSNMDIVFLVYFENIPCHIDDFYYGLKTLR